MSTHIRDAEKEIQLAKLLADRIGTRDPETREQVRQRLAMARAKIELAEQELDTVESLRGDGDGE